MPLWLSLLAVLSLATAFICCMVIVLDILRGHRQHMKVMEWVWPLTALFGGPLALLAYYRLGRLGTHQAMQQAREREEPPPNLRKPFPQMVAVGTLHCGSGCTLGDLVAEWFIFFIPLTLFGHSIFAAWVVDYIAAYLFGIAFQYYSIKPMRDLSPRQALLAAIKADTLSLTAWQVGMYGWMAIVTFLIFGHELTKTDPVFWFMMQIAMLAGFVTAYPVNWWLLRAGIKEKM